MNSINKHAWIQGCGLLLCVLGSSLAWCAEKPKIEDFRKGISRNKDWLDRYKWTYDYRILKLLAQRAGRVLDTENAKKYSDWLMSHPDGVEEKLFNEGLIVDEKKFLETARANWQKAYGQEAKSIETAHYLVLGTAVHQDYLKLLSFYMECIFKFYEGKFTSTEKLEGKFLLKFYPTQKDFLIQGPAMTCSRILAMPIVLWLAMGRLLPPTSCMPKII